MKKITLTLVCLMGLALAKANETHDMKPYTGSAEFEKMKSLQGKWQGTSQTGNQETASTVEYTVTANGSAVVEKLFPGTPHEMVSVYYDEAGKLAMTHYCAVGNHPKLELKKAEGNSYKFALSPKDKSISPKDMHMDQLELSFEGNGKLTQRWTAKQNGKDMDTTIINFTRVL